MNPYGSTTTGGYTGALEEEDPSSYPQIDLDKYPPPKDSTRKIRGKSELLETLVGGLEPELVVAKGFYFFFYAAFGSLFPLLGVYFKQLGLNGAQAGILSGIRPLIEFISAPLLIEIAQRRNKTRALMFFSLFCWIGLTFPLGSVQPEPVACLSSNKTHLILSPPEGSDTQYRRKREVLEEVEFEVEDAGIDPLLPPEEGDFPVLRRQKRKIPKEPKGVTPYKINSLYIGYDADKMSNWVSPTFSNLVFKKDDVGKVFFLLLLLVVLGEAAASPAIVLLDTRVLDYLGDAAAERYGHQRMFGSLGWAISMFFVGIALDQSKFPVKKCELALEKNYTVCFAIFVVLMSLATIMAWKLGEYTGVGLRGGDLEMVDKEPTSVPALQVSTSIEHTDKESGLPHSTVFSQANRSKISEWWNSVKHFKTPTCIGFLVVAWLMGIGIGLIFTFLFWHLQEFGGSPTLFGLASVINHISEIFAYFFSSSFICALGHVKVLCLGLLLNVLRFLYISILTNPWWVLPFEFVQGLTHAAVWAACSSYLSHNTPPELRQASQGLLHFLHHGLGRGFGAIVGGLFVSMYGTVTTFRLYAGLCALALAMFIFLNFYRKESGGFIRDLPQEIDPHNLAEETGCLAPHGVPGGSSGMQRVGSNVRLEDHGVSGGGFNPFNQQDQSEEYFGR